MRPQIKPDIIDNHSTMYSVIMLREEIRTYPLVGGYSGRCCQSIQQGGCHDCMPDARYHWNYRTHQVAA